MDLIETLRKSREFTLEHAGATFSLRLPTEYDLRRLFKQYTNGTTDSEALQRGTVLGALIGWENVTSGLVTRVPGQSEAVPYSPELAGAWLDEDVRISDTIATEIWHRIAKRREAMEGDEKNSPPGSSSLGTGTESTDSSLKG